MKMITMIGRRRGGGRTERERRKRERERRKRERERRKRERERRVLGNLHWFLRFNGISISVGLFNTKAILIEQQWHYLTHDWRDKRVHAFPQTLIPLIVKEQYWYYLTQALVGDKGFHTFPERYLSKSERSSLTCVRTPLLRCRGWTC